MEEAPNPGRTAILVVHGMGSQRPMETVRGIVDAVWPEDEDEGKEGPDSKRQYWIRPEPGGNDVDLLKIATTATQYGRGFDFHELYWAHLMSETRAVAVLLWLFELVAKGPGLKKGMNALWWVATIFLVLTNVCAAFFLLLAPLRLAQIENNPELLLKLPLAAIVFFTILSSFFLACYKTWLPSIVLFVVLIVIGFALQKGKVFDSGNFPGLAFMINHLLPWAVASLSAWVLMGLWGLFVTIGYFGIAFIGVIVKVRVGCASGFDLSAIECCVKQFGLLRPFSLDNNSSIVVSCFFIGVYSIVNALFLQPHIGDAARYFRNAPANVEVRREIRRQAVNTLEALHSSGHYDRIIVVAHSLGTVVAYDMLRAYFGRICRKIPDVSAPVGKAFDDLDCGKISCPVEFRKNGRLIIAAIAKSTLNPDAALPLSDPKSLRSWLVTDFVTLGSPLTHAQYLMCHKNSKENLAEDFKRRIKEREFPVCPPEHDPRDGVLTFINPNSGKRCFHHAALFGLTRWTNLYFPVAQSVWGDPIGGRVGGDELFGAGVCEVPISISPPEKSFNDEKGKYILPRCQDETEAREKRAKTRWQFLHTTYWQTDRKDGRSAEHIVALRAALDLEDRALRDAGHKGHPAV